MTWTLIGASLGSLAALMLIPALGPAFGVMGPMIKVLLGGMIGGVLGRLFAPQLESVASPKVLYGAAGGVVGGLAGGVPGASWALRAASPWAASWTRASSPRRTTRVSRHTTSGRSGPRGARRTSSASGRTTASTG